MTAASASTMRRDIASAYLASACKIGSWVVVSAVVYRQWGAEAFAVLALIRGTIGFLNYVSLGLAPALIHLGSRAQRAVAVISNDCDAADNHTLSYFTPAKPDSSLVGAYNHALLLTGLLFVAGIIITALFGTYFTQLFRMPGRVPLLAWDIRVIVNFIAGGTLFRLLGDTPGAVLQVRSRIALDNRVQALIELLWAVFGSAIVGFAHTASAGLMGLAITYTASGAIAASARNLFARRELRVKGLRLSSINLELVGQLLTYGGLIVLAQLADYLYAPTDYILINRLLDPVEVAFYAPAVQIDAGLLLLVTGLSAVILPKAALAHAGGDTSRVRQYYVRGTLASVGVLVVASILVWMLSPWIFCVWFGNSMPVTRSILPIVLVVTVIGGSSAIGRSILLAVGHVKPFTIAVLIAGVTNVIFSYAFVRWLHLGLKGIVLGTVVAVVGRCVIWMPWYVLRTLRTTPLKPVPSDFLPNVPV